MSKKYLEIAVTPAVADEQRRYFGRARGIDIATERDALGPDEMAFVQSRDCFFMATVSETGWPYLQHRGGTRGFLSVVDPHTLAFADYRGNRQLLSTGNLAANDRVSLLLMDYPRRERLKIIGRARVHNAREHPELVERFAGAASHSHVERIFVIEVTGFDWNCPKFITPRYTAAEVEEVVAPLTRRIAELEAELSRTRQISPEPA